MHVIWPPQQDDAEIICTAVKDVKIVTYQYNCSDCGDIHTQTKQEPVTVSIDDVAAKVHPHIRKVILARQMFEVTA